MSLAFTGTYQVGYRAGPGGQIHIYAQGEPPVFFLTRNTVRIPDGTYATLTEAQVAADAAAAAP